MSNNSVAGIIFDLEGTLIASEDALCTGLKLATPKQNWPAQWSRTELRDPFTAIMRSHGSPHELISFMEDSHITPMPGLSNMLEQLREEYLLAVVSNARKEILEVLLRQGGIERHFDVAVSIDDVSLGKPDPEGVHVACARLGLRAQETVVVGDTEQDAIAAQQAGAKFVLAQWGEGAIKDSDSLTVRDPAQLETLLRSWREYEKPTASPVVLRPSI